MNVASLKRELKEIESNHKASITRLELEIAALCVYLEQQEAELEDLRGELRG